MGMQAGFAGLPGCGPRSSIRHSSRPAGEGYAGDVLQVVEEAELVPVGQERGDGFAPVVADLKGEQAVGLERGARLGDEAAVEVEAVRTGEERCGGFMVAHLGMEGVAVGGGNI